MDQPTQNAPFFVDKEVIVLSKNGIWLSDGIEIDHQQTVKMFARSLKRDENGYFLQIAHETKRIQVEDTAFFILRIESSPDGSGIEICLNDETRERLDPKTLSYRPGRLTALIRGGKEEARFLHAAYFDLLKNLEEDERCYFLELSGQRIELAKK